MLFLLIIAFLQLQCTLCEDLTTEAFRRERIQGQCSAYCNGKYGTQLETKHGQYDPNTFTVWTCNGTAACVECNVACAEVFINSRICLSRCDEKIACRDGCEHHMKLSRYNDDLKDIKKQLFYDRPSSVSQDPNKRTESTLKIQWDGAFSKNNAVVFVILMYNQTAKSEGGVQDTDGLFMGYTSDYNYTIHPLSPKNCYHFRVITVTEDTILGSSNYDSTTIFATDPPIQIHNLTNTSVTITWESRPCEKDFLYEIQCISQPVIGNGPSSQLVPQPLIDPRSDLAETYAHIRGMVPNMKYVLSVQRSKKNAIRDFYSYSVKFKTLPSPPNTSVIITKVSPTANSLALVYGVEIERYLWSMDPTYYMVNYWPHNRKGAMIQNNITTSIPYAPDDRHAPPNSYTLSHLAAYTKYCISMAVGTDGGLGFWSKDMCNMTKAKGASAPRDLRVTNTSSTGVIIRITSPRYKNGKLKQYEIKYTCGAKQANASVPVGGTDVAYAKLFNLIPNTFCTVEVQAVNVEGDEGAEATITFTTREDVPIAAPPVTTCVVTSNKTSSNVTVTWQNVPSSHRRGKVTHFVLSVEHVRMNKEGEPIFSKNNETYADSNLNQTIVMFNSTPSLLFDAQEKVLARLAIQNSVGMGPWGKPFQCDIEPRRLSMTTGFITLIIGISVAMGVLVIALLMFFYFFRFKSYKKTPYEEVSKILKYQLFNDVTPCHHCAHKEEPKEWDVFICYIHEDEGFVEELKDCFLSEDVRVFFAKDELSWGCSLNGVIKLGLRNSKYGIVVLSKKFFDKCSKWTEQEVNALFSKQRLTKEDLILPVWLDITVKDVADYDLKLCDIQALKKETMSCSDMALELKKKLKEAETCWGCKSCNVSQSWSTSDFSIDNSPVDSLHTTLL